MFKILSVALLATVFMSGCGGGGGSSTNPPNLSSLASSSSSSAPLVSSSSSKSSVATSSSSKSSSSSSSSSSAGGVSSSSPTVVKLSNAFFTGANSSEGSVQTDVNGITTVTVAKDYVGAGYDLAPPFTGMRDGTVEFVVNVSTQFKASGAALIVYIYQTLTPYDGKNCETTSNTSLTQGVDQTISCVLDDDIFTQTSPIQFKLSAVPGVSTPAGTFVIKSARIVLP